VIFIDNGQTMQVRSEDKRYIEMAVEKYGKMLFRLCITLVRDYDDAEDAVQDTYMKYITKAPQFRDSEHEKAWLIRVATNICKNMIRFRNRNSSLTLDEIGEIGVSEIDSGIFEAIMSLPAKYKLVMDLHYIEGYTASEISGITGINADTVRKRMQNGRKLLKKNLEEMIDD
jgi:RNA polymerase sigma-70 factor (ECF subfamily)